VTNVDQHQTLLTLRARATLRWPRQPDGVGVFVVALAVNLVYWAVFRSHYVPVSDADHYFGIASNLAAGKGFSHVYPGTVLHETAFRLPFWPGLLAVALVVFGTHLSVAMALNAVIGALVAVQAAALARSVAGRRAGLVAGVVVALYPPLIANNVVPLSEPLGLLVMLVVVRLLGARRWMWAAVATGVLILTRDGAPIILLGAAPMVGLAAGWRQALRFLVVVGLIVVPWVVRNEVQLHHFVLTTSVGYNLAAVYSEQAQATNLYFVDATRDPAFAQWWPERSNEARWDATLEHEGLEGLDSDPLRVLAVARFNLGNVIGFHSRDEDGAELLDGRVIRVVKASKPAYYLVSILGVAGLVRWRRNRTVRALAMVAVLLVGLSLVTVYAPRLRAPVDLACAIGVGLLCAPSRPPPDQAVDDDAESCQLSPA